MPARRFRSSGFSRGKRQPTNWARAETSEMVTAANAFAIRTTVVLSNPGINETIRRTRGGLFVVIGGAGTGTIHGAFGGMVISDQAIAAGGASLPDPIGNANDDGWFVWLPWAIRVSTQAAAVGAVFQFDSKAMRRIEEGYGVVFMIGNATDSDASVTSVLGISLLTSLT